MDLMSIVYHQLFSTYDHAVKEKFCKGMLTIRQKMAKIKNSHFLAIIG